MANVVKTQVMLDGPRNLIIKIVGNLDTSDISATDLFDPAARAVIGQIEGLANRYAIEEIHHNIEDSLAVYLYWGATTDDLIVPLEGRGKIPFDPPLNNTEATGVTGKIRYATQGWTVGAVLSFAVELVLRKYIK